MDQLKLDRILTFSIDSAQYVAWPNNGFEIGPVDKIGTNCLATVIRVTDAREIVSELLKAAECLFKDDVFRREFLSCVLIRCDSAAPPDCGEDFLRLLKSWGTTSHAFLPSDSRLASGPYVVTDSKLVPAFRIFEDSIGAFVSSFEPSDGTHQSDLRPLRLGTGTHHSRVIAVGNRVAAAQERGKRALAGLRMTTKDMFDVRGHRTGLGSRAFLELAAPSRETAPAIQMLVDAGAHLVGVTQMCAMVGKQEPTQSVDYTAPFNPRGDGFQSPSGGSSGQPSAVAAYDWLDFALGSDATVSGRLPAQANGCFSFRPSHGLVPTQGMWSAVPQFDSVCVFARSLEVVKRVTKLWATCKPTEDEEEKEEKEEEEEEEEEGEAVRSVSAIYAFSEFLPRQNTAQMTVYDSFTHALSQWLGVPITQLSLEEEWVREPPERSSGLSLHDFLDESVSVNSYIASFWHKIEAYYDHYQRTFGKRPFMPLPKGIDLWDPAKDVSREQQDAAWERLSIYKDWVLHKLLCCQRQNPIVVMPLGDVRPCYRDEWPSDDGKAQMMWEPLLLAPILGAPELVVPAGQIPYHSRISGNMEHLPVCVSVMGLPGTDVELVEMLGRFVEATGRPASVMTGRTMFPVDWQDDIHY